MDKHKNWDILKSITLLDELKIWVWKTIWDILVTKNPFNLINYKMWILWWSILWFYVYVVNKSFWIENAIISWSKQFFYTFIIAWFISKVWQLLKKNCIRNWTTIWIFLPSSFTIFLTWIIHLDTPNYVGSILWTCILAPTWLYFLLRDRSNK